MSAFYGTTMGANDPEWSGGLLGVSSQIWAASPRNFIMSDTFEWLPTESAPEAYPIFLVKGDLVFPDGKNLYIPDRRPMYNGWGKTGSAHLVGQKRKPLPSRLDLTWFSYTEDRFYVGHFDLPTERLTTLFRSGAASPDGGARLPFDRIIVGMAPGGDVAVWVGAGRIVRQIALYRAQPADLPWTLVLNNPSISRAEYIDMSLKDALPPDVLKQVTGKAVPAGRWAIFSQRYAWTTRLAGGLSGKELWIRGLNGEVEWLDLTGGRKDADPAPPTRGAPLGLTLFWTTKGGQRLSAEITFDEDESLAAFSKLAGAATPEPLVLELEPSDQATTVEVFLQRGRFAYRFEKNSVKIYRAD